MNHDDVFVISAKRTPIGSFMGSLSSVSATQLGSASIAAAVKEASIDPETVSEVLMGNVLSAGLGQAPARQASLAAGIPNHVPTTTVGRVCGSGMHSVLLAARAIRCGEADVVVAGGMENMSQVPHYLPQSRTGTRLGHGKFIDGMIHDGLWDPYNDFHMGQAGELCARKFELSREAQDEFAKESYRRALAAQEAGLFAAELAPINIPSRRGEDTVVATDEEPGRGRPDKFAKLRPAFDKEGTITAANASSINDGAAALTLASKSAVERHGLKPIARILSTGVSAQAPEWFTTAPVKAIEQALARAKLKATDIDLWEINEAFSCVAMSCAQLCDVSLNAVNIHGGAVALGHPIGASGARILTTLIHALRQTDKKRGVASLCIGGGEGISTVVEAL